MNLLKPRTARLQKTERGFFLALRNFVNVILLDFAFITS